MSTGEWADVYREKLRARGYEMRGCSWDAYFGWTVLAAPVGGGRDAEVEYEGRSTQGVQAWIARLPVAAEAVVDLKVRADFATDPELDRIYDGGET